MKSFTTATCTARDASVIVFDTSCRAAVVVR